MKEEVEEFINAVDKTELPTIKGLKENRVELNSNDGRNRQKELYEKLDKIDNAHNILSTLAWHEKLIRNLIDCAEGIDQLKLIEHFLDKKLEEIENDH